MPIHLPPISRRHFLQRSLAAGAGILLAPGLLSAAKPTDPHVWAMLADTHIAADPAQVGRFNLNVTDHLKHVCQEIVALETAPAGVIVHGDCAFSKGKPGDYTQFLKLLQPVRQSELPIHLALGNHDHLQNFLDAAQPKSPSPVKQKYVSTVQSERANFFILDSLQNDPPSTPSNPGELGKAQRQWLAKQLKEHKEKPAIVIVHHTPASIQDWKHLVALMDKHQQVKAMFYGHRHTWGLDKTPGGVHLINLLPVSYPSPESPKPAPTDGATGWTQATFATDRVSLHVRCIDRVHKLHDTVHELKWRDM
jgi:predicted phosphodiesterase